MQISPHFWQKEFSLDGNPSPIVVPTMLLIALESYRECIKAEHDVKIEFMNPDAVFTGIAITSFARSQEYNHKKGGHPNSHHLYSQYLRSYPDAVDFTYEKFDMYNHEKHLDTVREHMLTYNIFLSTGYYKHKRFIHLNLEQSRAEMRHWSK